MSKIEDRVDQAASNYRAGKPIKDPDLQSLLETMDVLKPLEDVHAPDLARAQQARQAFLIRVKETLPVSLPELNRHIGWKNILKKERSPMFTFARILILLAVAFGGTTATAFAAQDSLPSEALYPIKTFVEDVRLALTTDPEAEVNLLLQLSDERMEEIAALMEQGVPVPDAVATQLQSHLNSALKTCAELDGAAFLQVMEQIHERSQQQLKELENLGDGSDNQPEDALQLATQAMNSTRVAAEGALEDPITFRLHQGTNRPLDAPEQGDMIPADGTGDSQGPGNKGSNGKKGPGNQDTTP
jgi:TolA-binding protein